MSTSNTLNIEVELRADVAFRSRAGAGATIDFIPGIALLGCMGRHYLKAQAQGLAWDIFHSGATRFTDARIVRDAGVPARPMPLSFRFAKGAEGRVSLSDAREFLGAFSPAIQDACVVKDGHKADRAGAQVWPTGEIAKVRTRVDLKTAIAWRTQRAKDGALFNVVTLERGQRFRGQVQCANAQVRDFIADRIEGDARMGWSRRAEYGRVAIRLLPDTPRWPTAFVKLDGKQRFLLLSDACLLDPVTGLATSAPAGAHFGLPGAQLNRSETFIRLSRFTPFNAHHKRPAMERVALQAGSVITFDVSGDARPSGFDWVGAHNAEGLGQVWIDAPGLDDWPGSTAEHGSADPLPGQPAEIDGELQKWRAEHAAATQQRVVAEQVGAGIFAALRGKAHPSPSQWRRVARAARGVKTAADLGAALAPICKAGVAQHQWAKIMPAFEKAIAGAPPLGVALAAESLARVARTGESS